MGSASEGTDPCYPPLGTKYAHLIQREENPETSVAVVVVGECELPLIDLQLLTSPNPWQQHKCAQQIMEACSHWGFFQAINHGLPPALIHQLHAHAAKLFSLPFQVKKNVVGKHLFPYMWGTPTGAHNLNNSNWMESFLISSQAVAASSSVDHIQDIDFSALRVTMEEYGRAMGRIGCEVLGALASEMGLNPCYLSDSYSAADSFIKLNCYPPCKKPWAVHGMEPHTDSDLITLIHQDHVGGLQILKDNYWINVEPKPDALVINIGDLLQAWSNDVYKSVKHRVAVNCNEERVSVGYFLFPFKDTLILNPNQSGCHYRGFTPIDFKEQVRKDIELTGSKLGLPHFRIHHNNV